MNMKVIRKKLLGIFACMLMLCAVGQMCVGKEMAGTTNNEPFVVLMYDPHSHDFGYMQENETDSTVFEIWRGGGCCALTYTLSENYEWIDVFPTSGASNGEHDPITVTVNTAGMDPGSYEGKIRITSNGGSGTFDVSVNIIGPSLLYAPESYDFGDISEGETDSTVFEIWNGGNGTLTYTLTPGCSWVSVLPTSGESKGEHDPIIVSVDTTGLDIGFYTCDISIESNGGSGVFTVAVNVVNASFEIEIVDISGGFGVTATIKNVGDVDATGVEWSITLDGGFILLGRQKTGRIECLLAQSEISVSSDLIIGFGKTVVNVCAEIPESSATKKQNAFVLLFFIMIIDA